MKGPIKRIRTELERGVARAWEGMTDGWRELLTRSNGALTHFARHGSKRGTASLPGPFPQWALLAGDAWETAHAVIVRLELPGLKKEDIDVSITRSGLRVRGEKHSQDAPPKRSYHLMERAFGRFERTITLPRNIDAKNAEIEYQDGVLTVIVPKTESTPPTRLPV
jgi:HSP20 family protein